MTDGSRAVLWDLDGTLIDSRDYHWRAWRDVMKAAGAPITESAFEASFGQRNEAFLGKWLGPDADAERIRRVADVKEAHYRELLGREGIGPLPGAREWVDALHVAGWRQAIASSAPRANVEAVEAALGFTALIDVVVAAEDVREGKPVPEVFLTAASRLEVPPSRCVVVEDAWAGIEAARRAGMRSIGVGGAPGDVAVESLTELPADAFEELLRGGSGPGDSPARPRENA